MFTLKVSGALLALILFAGCGEGVQYAMDNYSGVKVQKFPHGNDTWRILDKPEESRLMITSSLGKAVEAGAVQGASLGLADAPHAAEAEFQAAASDFLKIRNQSCEIVSGRLVVLPQYEYFYKCS